MTVEELKKKYRKWQYGAFFGEFISLLAPYIVLGAINFEDWFIQESGWKVGLGGVLGMALAGIALLLVNKKQSDDMKREAGEKPSTAVVSYEWIVLILGWVMAIIIISLIETILHQIVQIMIGGLIGLVGACGFDIAHIELKKKANKLQEDLEQSNRELIREQAKKEIAESGKLHKILNGKKGG